MPKHPTSEPPLEARVPTEAHHEFQRGVLALTNKLTEEHNASQVELLAIMANMLGQMLALQDSRQPVQYYMKVIEANLVVGNQSAIQQAIDMPTDGEV